MKMLEVVLNHTLPMYQICRKEHPKLCRCSLITHNKILEEFCRLNIIDIQTTVKLSFTNISMR